MIDKTLTKEYMYDLIVSGYFKLSDLGENQRRKLISIFLTELSRNESTFEDQEPGKRWLSHFLENPSNPEGSHRLANEITDCVLFSHDHVLEKMFEEVLLSYQKEIGVYSDYDDLINADNRSRYLDVSF